MATSLLSIPYSDFISLKTLRGLALYYIQNDYNYRLYLYDYYNDTLLNAELVRSNPSTELTDFETNFLPTAIFITDTDTIIVKEFLKANQAPISQQYPYNFGKGIVGYGINPSGHNIVPLRVDPYGRVETLGNLSINPGDIKIGSVTIQDDDGLTRADVLKDGDIFNLGVDNDKGLLIYGAKKSDNSLHLLSLDPSGCLNIHVKNDLSDPVPVTQSSFVAIQTTFTYLANKDVNTIIETDGVRIKTTAFSYNAQRQIINISESIT